MDCRQACLSLLDMLMTFVLPLTVRLLNPMVLLCQVNLDSEDIYALEVFIYCYYYKRRITIHESSKQSQLLISSTFIYTLKNILWLQHFH